MAFRIVTKIMKMFEGPMRTGKGITKEPALFQAMFTGRYYSWCVKCGRTNHCGEFQVENLGALDVICNSCRLVEARSRNYPIEGSPVDMGWSL